MSQGVTRRGDALRHVEGRPAILSVAFPYAPIGSLAVGGAEVICSQTEAAMTSLGFRSVVVAHAGSRTEGSLYGTEVPAGTITDAVRRSVEAAHQTNIDQALASEGVALVHMHGLDFHRYRIPGGMPVLVTLHLPPSWYPESIWDLPSNYHLVCVSESQRQACPESVRARLYTVENGVVIPGESTLRAAGKYALLMARICPEKNLHTGLDAAKLAGMPALLGGEVFAYEAHQQYFREEIEPRLTSLGEEHQGRRNGATQGPTARFVGAISREDKARVMSRAACLLLPSLAPETSSLVAMEALAAGVPVIGMNVGAVPEIVEHGKTGFLIEPGEGAVAKMAAAIRELPRLNRTTCRSVAEERFPLHRMLEGYSVLYRRLVAAPERANELAASWSASASQETFVSPESEMRAEQVCLEHVVTLEGLEELEAEWTSVWHEDVSSTPFQHPAWLLPWWRQFGPDGELWAHTLRDRSDGRLLVFVPLYVYCQPGENRRKLLLAGAGTTDYLDGVWTSDRKLLGGVVLQGILEAAADMWDDCSLHQLRAESPLVLAVEENRLLVDESEPTSVLNLGIDLPAKIRANVERYRRRAEKEGQLALRVAESKAEALAMFETLVELHSNWWQRRGEAGVLSDPRVLAHHREAIPRLLQAGLLRMYRLTLSGEIMGVLYALADTARKNRPHQYLYLIGISEHFAHLSPGTLLLHEVWLYAREHGFAALDLLRGGEAYKSLWGAANECTFAVQIAGQELTGASVVPGTQHPH